MDDERANQEMMRNQVIAVILMILFAFVFFHFFPLTGPPKPVQPPPEQVRETVPEEPARPVSPAAATATLPPVPERTNPAEDEIKITGNDFELVFTRIGGRIKQVAVLVNHGSDALQPLVPVQTVPDTEAIYPMGLRLYDLGEELNSRRWDASVAGDQRGVTFTLTIPGRALIQKAFTLGEDRHVLNVRVDYQNLAAEPQVIGMDQIPAYYLLWGPNISSNDESKGVRQSVVWYKDDEVCNLATASMTSDSGKPFAQEIADPDWLGVKSTYFLVAMKPEFEVTQGIATGNPKTFQFGLAVPRFELAPGAVQTNHFSLYVGPMERTALRAAWPTLAAALQFFQSPWTFMDWFAKLLLDILNGFYALIPNYGLAIIFLTVLVRVVLFPLTVKSMKSMKKMQLLAPELQALKEKYGENQQELNQKMLELYRERGVNPMGGCLPLLLQMPVLFALYRMLGSAYELKGAPFMLWIGDLSQPDRLVHIPAMAQIPFLGIFQYVNLLPILMGFSMVLQNRLAPMSGPVQNQQQKIMMTFMPIFIAFVCYNLASGLNLYMITTTVLSIVQQRFTWVGEVDLTPKKKTKRMAWKRKHFYAAAQERKRQMAKEAKRDRKRKS